MKRTNRRQRLNRWRSRIARAASRYIRKGPASPCAIANTTHFVARYLRGEMRAGGNRRLNARRFVRLWCRARSGEALRQTSTTLGTFSRGLSGEL